MFFARIRVKSLEKSLLAHRAGAAVVCREQGVSGITMTKNRSLAFCLMLLSFASFATYAQAQQTIISANRSVDWRNAGIAGGIPNRTTICSTLNPGASSSQINSAIAACPSGQVVKLNPGTYNLSAGIGFNNKSNVTVRGSGANQTFLIFSGNNACHGTSADVCFDSGDTSYKGGPSNTANWTAGFAKGTTVLTLSSTSNLAVGKPITLDQLDDSSDSGDVYVCASSGCASDGDGGGPRPGRGQQQLVTVTAISGNQVTISPGLYMPNWRSGQSPQAWWATSPIANSGIEDLSADHTSSGATAGFEFFNCVGCWVKGVRSIKANRSHVYILQSNRCVVRDSYFYENLNHASSSYGVEATPSSDTLIENNIFQAVTAPRVMTGSCSGCVISYNFSINDRFTGSNTWLSQSDFLHAVGDDMMLFEGNVGAGIYSDNFHGTHHFITAFRNRYDGYEKNGGFVTNGNTHPLPLNAFSRFYNIVGNVLGSVDLPHNNYQETPTSGGGSQSIYVIGGGDGIPDDSNVERTLLRWGNYDTVTKTVRFVNTEIPSAIANFANTLPSQTLPASMYLASRPSFFPAGKAWPPIGPDVTGGNIPNVGGFANTIPAQDCYLAMGGPADGTGNVLAFDPASCYLGGVSKPAAPTNLRIIR
jgi:hypothetical protein